MSDIKISEMPEASELNESDLLMVVQNGSNKKVKIDKLGISDIQEKINATGVYSSEGVDTGKKWIDGKPIYRAILQYPAIANGKSTSVSAVSLNINRIISVNGIGTLADNGSVIPIPYLYEGNYITWYEEAHKFVILAHGYALTNETYLTIEYLKND